MKVHGSLLRTFIFLVLIPSIFALNCTRCDDDCSQACYDLCDGQVSDYECPWNRHERNVQPTCTCYSVVSDLVFSPIGITVIILSTLFCCSCCIGWATICVVRNKDWKKKRSEERSRLINGNSTDFRYYSLSKKDIEEKESLIIKDELLQPSPTEEVTPVLEVKEKDPTIIENFEISGKSFDQLVYLANNYKTSVLSILLTVFDVLLQKYTNEEEIWTIVALAPHQVVSKAIFAATSTLEKVIETVMSSYATQNFQQKTGYFIFYWEETLKGNEKEIPSVLWNQMELKPFTVRKGGLMAELDLEPNKVSIKFSHKKLLSLPSPVLRFRSHLTQLLTYFNNGNLGSSIGTFSIMTEEEERDIMEKAVGIPYNPNFCREETLIDIFEESAKQHAQNLALICAGEEMRYWELDEKSNQLARYLKGKGVERGDYVAMLIPRSNRVFVSLLGIMKADSAYVPIDPDYPSDRVYYILEDSKSKFIVTTVEMVEKHKSFPCPVILIDQDWRLIRQEDPKTIDNRLATNRDVCYIIYTSGSTGRPKGVQIEHRSVCNLVRAEREMFKVNSKDRVYQGFSIAFDASVEEVWLSFAAGATQVVATYEMAHSGPLLSSLLTEARVTVLDCVPTLLSMLEDDIPTVRLLILGGEQLQSDLVNRWCKRERMMVNTYGPTEATVIATYSVCQPEIPVTIGRPVPNYKAYILDANMKPVPLGVIGELHIGGPCLARGYLNRADLTDQKFVPNPFSDNKDEKLYKTGDLARFVEDYNIDFMGRADGQVKLRGFRVELSEIESVLMQCPSILTAVVTVRKENDVDVLVGYVVPKDRDVDEKEVKAQIKDKLPPYMIPAYLEPITSDQIPTLSSGKVDRKRLPEPKRRPKPVQVAESSDKSHLPPLQAKVLECWEAAFAPNPVRVTDDFFELGGHSLLAARLVSAMRKIPEMQKITVLNLYQSTTIEKLCSSFQEDTGSLKLSKRNLKWKANGTWNYIFCGFFQIVFSYFLFAVYCLTWSVSYTIWNLLDDTLPLEWLAVCIIGGYGLAIYLLLFIPVVFKWILIGRFKEGSYKVWGWFYFRFWFVNRLMDLAPVDFLSGTPLLPLYYRLLGAKIGSNVYLSSTNVFTWDLVEIGDNACINNDCYLMTYAFEQGLLKIEKIIIEEGCCVGSRAVINRGAKMYEGATLGDMSMLPPKAKIPAGQFWRGSPASAKNGMAAGFQKNSYSPVSLGTKFGRFVAGIFYLFVVALIPLFLIIPAIPSVAFAYMFFDQWWLPFAAPGLALIFIVVLCLEILLAKWILLGTISEGKHSINSFFYFRYWIVSVLMELSLTYLGSLYSTLYLYPFLVSLGAKVNSSSEISTLTGISADLLEVGRECFVADDTVLGPPLVQNGQITFVKTKIGERCFLGNSSFIPQGSKIGDGTLIGLYSTTPSRDVPPETTWLGSPPFLLPNRQKDFNVDIKYTFKPTASLWIGRLTMEFFRLVLPMTAVIATTIVAMWILDNLILILDLEYFIVIFPLIFWSMGIAMCFLVIILKWLLMGKYKPRVEPLWSFFVWRTELVGALFEDLASPFFLSMYQGTPVISWYWWLLGAKIGSRVVWDSFDVTEPDLVTIGDDVALNRDCGIQTHLFEDRIMKMSSVTIKSKCSVGARAAVLYDTTLEKGARINSLSLVMKGETVPTWTAWQGIPIKKM